MYQTRYRLQCLVSSVLKHEFISNHKIILLSCCPLCTVESSPSNVTSAAASHLGSVPVRIRRQTSVLTAVSQEVEKPGDWPWPAGEGRQLQHTDFLTFLSSFQDCANPKNTQLCQNSCSSQVKLALVLLKETTVRHVVSRTASRVSLCHMVMWHCQLPTVRVSSLLGTKQISWLLITC